MPVYVCIVVFETQCCETIMRQLFRALMASVDSLPMHTLQAESSFTLRMTYADPPDAWRVTSRKYSDAIGTIFR